MKETKRWIALILAITLVSGLCIRQLNTYMSAEEIVQEGEESQESLEALSEAEEAQKAAEEAAAAEAAREAEKKAEEAAAKAAAEEAAKQAAEKTGETEGGEIVAGESGGGAAENAGVIHENAAEGLVVSADAEPRTFTQTVGDLLVTVAEGAAGVLPAEAELSVTEIAQVEELAQIENTINEDEQVETESVKEMVALDIRFLVNGEEVQPNGEVKVSFSNIALEAPAEELSVYHVDTETNEVQDMQAESTEENELEFVTPHFSTYVIVYGGESDGKSNVTINHYNGEYDYYSYKSGWSTVTKNLVDYVNSIKSDGTSGLSAPGTNDFDKARIYLTDQMEVYKNNDGERIIEHYAKVFDDSDDERDAEDQQSHWKVEKVVVTEKNANGVVLKTTVLGTVNEWKSLSVSNPNVIVDVYYKKTEKIESGFTTLYDYTVRGGTATVNNKKFEQVSINSWDWTGTNKWWVDGTISKVGDSQKRYLTVGASNEGKSGKVPNYDKYKFDWTLTRDSVGELKPNHWTGEDTVKGPDGKQTNRTMTGLLAYMDSNHQPVFKYANPGFFNNEDVSVTVNGQKKYLRQHFTNYTLEFDREGDHYTLNRVVKPDGKTTAAYAGDDFFPLDGVGNYGNRDDAHQYNRNDKDTAGDWSDYNYYFGMRYDVEFELGDYCGPLEYYFSGDDDIWVVVDDTVIALELAGIHLPVERTIDLWPVLQQAGIATKGQKNPGKHTLTVLYMERGGDQSNCEMSFVLPNAKITQITDVPFGEFTIKKTDDAENPIALQNAEFSLTGTGYSDLKKTDASGQVTFGKLKAGSYSLKETQAPSGYQKLDKTWTITVTNSSDNQTASVTGVTSENDQTKWSWNGTNLELTVKDPAYQKVVKIFKGLDESEVAAVNAQGYKINLVKGNTSKELKLTDSNCKKTVPQGSTKEYVYTWTLDNLTTGGKYTVSEDNETYSTYSIERTLWSNDTNKVPNWNGRDRELTVGNGEIIYLKNEYKEAGAKLDIKKYGSEYTVDEKAGSKFTITKGTWMTNDTTGEKTFVESRDSNGAAEYSVEFDPNDKSPEYGGAEELLNAGDYVLEEKVAPSGYVLLAPKIYLRVENGEVKLVDENGAAKTADSNGVTEEVMWKLEGSKANGYILRIKNDVLYSLPSTGGVGIYTTTMLGVSLMILAMAMGKRKQLI